MAETRQALQRPHTNKKEIDLKEYYELIRRRIWIVVCVTVLVTIVGFILNSKNDSHSTGETVYESSTRMIVDAGEDSMNTLLVMIKDPFMLEKVNEKLNLNKSVENLAAQITVATIDKSQVVKISVVDPEAKTAADIANTTVKVFKSEIAELMGFKKVKLLTPAKANTTPIDTNAASGLSIEVFMVAGIAIGIGLVFLLDSLDGTIKKEQEIEEMFDIPALGSISNMTKKKWSFKKSKSQKSTVRGEAFDLE
ncbi:capsular biosynthesis protein [Domibacillus sp.]|uniref:YveK family protein n=1 Tax=Domibacillus sp. TaxID=1969783 RepID=UPI0028117BA1|nr:capsular biosynthesis protein [Domibacillus sp.]